MISIQRSPASKAFYDGERAQGKQHTQAVIALARRRFNMLWLMLRDHQLYQERQQKSVSPLDKRMRIRCRRLAERANESEPSV